MVSKAAVVLLLVLMGCKDGAPWDSYSKRDKAMLEDIIRLNAKNKERDYEAGNQSSQAWVTVLPGRDGSTCFYCDGDRCGTIRCHVID